MSDQEFAEPERTGERDSDAEIEAQVRAIYGSRLEACERVRQFGEDALYAWAGRPIDPESVDAIVLAEASRATKTFGAVLRLVAAGFGPQAVMLNRSLFEGTAVAHWAYANGDSAVELFKMWAICFAPPIAWRCRVKLVKPPRGA